MPVRLTFYDGVDCIGGNKILLEDGATAIFLDFGMNFKAESMFFDEFLVPRNSFGLYDLFCLGILPPLRGVYRKDLEYPGIWDRFSSYPLFREVGLSGVLVSHIHLDHCGYLPYLREDIPIITSLTSALVGKVLQDTWGARNRLGEICYAAPRELRDGMLQTVQKAPLRQRPYKVAGTETVREEACEFWRNVYGSKKLNHCPLEAYGGEFEIGELLIRFWPVDHSIPGSGAFGIRTSLGWVVYTGDLRVHGRNAALTRQFFAEVAELEPLVLICEGTHLDVDDPLTEEEVASNCLEVVAQSEGLVVADFGPRNVERLLSFLRIAKETDRCLVLTPKDVYLLEALRAGGENIPDPSREERIALYVKPKARKERWEETLEGKLGSTKIVSPERIRKEPREYIL